MRVAECPTMIRICLDTNAFHENWLATGEAFTFIADLIAKEEAHVYVSEITILEHVRQYDKQKSTIESGLKSNLTLAKLSLVESADYPVRQAGFFANLDSSGSWTNLECAIPYAGKLQVNSSVTISHADICFDVTLWQRI